MLVPLTEDPLPQDVPQGARRANLGSSCPQPSGQPLGAAHLTESQCGATSVPLRRPQRRDLCDPTSDQPTDRPGGPVPPLSSRRRQSLARCWSLAAQAAAQAAVRAAPGRARQVPEPPPLPRPAGPVTRPRWPPGPRTSPARNPVVIGVLYTDDNPIGIAPEIKSAGEAAAAYVNSHGGVGGRPVKIVACNGMNNAQNDAQCATQFVNSGVVTVEGLDGFWGGVGVSIIGKAGIANQTLPISGPEFSAPNAYPWEGSGITASAAAASYFVQQKMTSACAYQDIPSFQEQCIDDFQKPAESLGAHPQTGHHPADGERHEPVRREAQADRRQGGSGGRRVRREHRTLSRRRRRSATSRSGSCPRSARTSSSRSERTRTARSSTTTWSTPPTRRTRTPRCSGPRWPSGPPARCSTPSRS